MSRRRRCYLTDYRDYDEHHLARLYNKASLHGIDCFFMQVRRRPSILEHPIASASDTGRTWYGYSAYHPETIVKMLGIFRVFYNYCLASEDSRTPAMRACQGQDRLGRHHLLSIGAKKYGEHRAPQNLYIPLRNG